LEVVHIVNRNQFAATVKQAKLTGLPLGEPVDALGSRDIGSLDPSLGIFGTALRSDPFAGLQSIFPFATSSSPAAGAPAQGKSSIFKLPTLSPASSSSMRPTAVGDEDTMQVTAERLAALYGVGAASKKTGAKPNLLSDLLGTAGDKKLNDAKGALNADSVALLSSTDASVQCSAAVDYIDVKCGDMISVTLDREDACLATSFQPHAAFATERIFTQDEFEASFGDQGFQFSKGAKGMAVRGTSVRLLVEAQDECTSVAAAVVDPNRECEFRVAGKCCPAVSAPIRLELTDFAK